MENVCTLSEYFVYFCDKIFNSGDVFSENVLKNWKDLRCLLIQNPINIDNIKMFVKEMYDIKTIPIKDEVKIESKDIPNKNRLSIGHNKNENERRKTMILKRKSTVLGENHMNQMYFNTQIEPILQSKSTFKQQNSINNIIVTQTFDDVSEISEKASITNFSISNFNFIEPKFDAINLKKDKFDGRTLLNKVNAFKQVFSEDSTVLDQNFDNIVNELNSKGLEMNRNLSISNKIVEDNLKNYTFYFTEAYENVKQQLNF